MSHRPSVVEQALALARTGMPLTRIIRQLSAEGYLDAPAQLDGMAIRRKIRDLNRLGSAEAKSASGSNA